ncbi:hypothetical protein T11_12868 [Trichinella zimbabwensis]|uniref:PiggyBac transposable element-derived protein domain-containing protein n=1 Tax=Trichinella zimbabwensis TaxID=268475 RepID=A0A0V1GQ24_9BILA|nr:hypothetical protein T11_12868 [Trichinella zimbabwensis]
MFHEKFSVDESVVPYYGRHGAKLFVKGKQIRRCKRQTPDLTTRHTLYFDNDFNSYHLLVKLAVLKMRAIKTIRPFCNNGADTVMLPDKQLMKQKRGAFDFRSDGNVYIDKWNDNAIVKMTTNGQPYESERTASTRAASGFMSEIPDLQYMWCKPYSWYRTTSRLQDMQTKNQKYVQKMQRSTTCRARETML